MRDAVACGRVLICAATGFEAQACARALARVPGAGGRFEVLKTGMGMPAAGQALVRRLLAGPRPLLVVSTGLAGSVRPDLAVGTWVSGTGVVKEDAAPIALSDGLGRLWHRAGVVCRAKTFRTVTGITLDADPAAPHATVVDMETYAWADIAARHRLPCAALRIISDTPEQPLPAFIAALTALTQVDKITQKVGHLGGALCGVLAAPQGAAQAWRRSRALAHAITSTWAKIAALTPRDIQEALEA